MDPLMIARARRKRIDPRLVDGDPIRNAKFLSNPLAQAGKCKVTHLIPPLSAPSRHILPYCSRNAFFLILPTLVFGIWSAAYATTA
jgi:hypothetical protein